MKKEKTPIIIITGPTATGKTGLALNLCRKFDGEIISADSRQVYSSMDVGTGKEPCNPDLTVTKNTGFWTVENIPIYGYDVVAPDQEFSVSHFHTLAQEKIREITAKGKIPFIVGGTGFYLKSLMGDFATIGIKPDWELRKELEKLQNEKGIKALADELISLDPRRAKKVDLKNPRRIIRAIEVCHAKKAKPVKNEKTDLRFLWIGINLPRTLLYEKADKRIETMMSCGLLEEIKQLRQNGYGWELPSMSGIGYRQLRPYLEENAPLEECVQQLKWDTHAYIRRQETWFRKQAAIEWCCFSGSGSEKQIEMKIKRLLKQ